MVTLTCPSCGSKLQITNDIERFACSSCGNEHIVRRSGGAVSVTPIISGMNEIGAKIDRVSLQLEIQNLHLEQTRLRELIHLMSENIYERYAQGDLAGFLGVIFGAKKRDVRRLDAVTEDLRIVNSRILELQGMLNKHK
ncbi:MAG: hypothetical protein KIT77_25565 [Caldilinea sp.]|nr:hypothetical protein [Caldilinea sp.]